MSEEQKMQVAKIVTPEEQKKIEAWGKFGAQLYNSEIVLQLQAQEIINKLIDPTMPELIASAEQAHATVKKEYLELQKQRIAVTSKFDPVIARLSSHEKSLLACLQINANAILAAKQKVKEAAKTKEAKVKELLEIEKQVLIYTADMHASYLNAHLSLLTKAYEHALTTNLSMEALPDFKTKLCARVNLTSCITPPPKPTFQYNMQQDVDAVVAKYFHPMEPAEFVKSFAKVVEDKFSDWEHALQNKQAAKELHEKEFNNVSNEITQELEKLKVSAGLNALAGPLEQEPIGKQLKEVWQIAEPNTVDEMFAIINAFVVNRSDVQEHISKIKPINFGIKQMMAALVAVKTLDENFEITGITFYKIEKL